METIATLIKIKTKVEQVGFKIKAESVGFKKRLKIIIFKMTITQMKKIVIIFQMSMFYNTIARKPILGYIQLMVKNHKSRQGSYHRRLRMLII